MCPEGTHITKSCRCYKNERARKEKVVDELLAEEVDVPADYKREELGLEDAIRMGQEAEEFRRVGRQQRQVKEEDALRRLRLAEKLENQDLDRRLRHVSPMRMMPQMQTENIFGSSYKPIDLSKYL